MELLLKLNHILHDYASNHANELPSLLMARLDSGQRLDW